jgi:superfamily II DNA or RNA helicase
MQISPSSRDDRPAVRPGDLVHVRRARWRIVQVRAYEDCQVVTLCGLTPPHLGIERRILTPFDILEPIDHSARPRIVRNVRWRRACRALIAADGPPGALRAARAARIDLLPYQLEPALAILRGLGTRLLLADEVGLGKTIQAGLIASELLGRGSIDRVLVLTPPGLREQWRQELGDRFAIEAVNVDGYALKRLAASLPIGVNPWRTLSTAIASIDYVKRPEVFPAVASCRWDLVIADEAHASAGDSDRRAVVHALTARAAYVLLLSATPHSGDRESFAALCALGAEDAGADRPTDDPADAPLLVFRRTRADAGIAIRRRVHIVRIRPSADEMRMHAMLARYSDAVRAERDEHGRRDAWLALAVLHKRALSSAWSLAQSVERRRAALSAASSAQGGIGEQLALPLGDPQGELVTADEAPSWPADLHLSDPARERRLLRALSVCAHSAAASEKKLAALGTLLRRANQSAVVFTEYRDTLLHVRQRLARPTLVLHGGLARDERRAVLAAFARDPSALLLATDAAAEGLNLHRGCRLVINLELPWNPMRLEQRIGRVDRIGQRRTVHAFHLVADGTGETRILSRLRARIAVARADIGAPDPLGNDDQDMARLAVAGEPDE